MADVHFEKWLMLWQVSSSSSRSSRVKLHELALQCQQDLISVE